MFPTTHQPNEISWGRIELDELAVSDGSRHSHFWLAQSEFDCLGEKFKLLSNIWSVCPYAQKEMRQPESKVTIQFTHNDGTPESS